VTAQAAVGPPPRVGSDGPYVGLTHYTEAEAEFFFGREAERRRIIGNLRGTRLTLLYAESGVGKSSLLRAGVAARLAELARTTEPGTGLYVPVVFSSWGDDPVAAIVDAIGRAIGPFLPPDGEQRSRRDTLEDAIVAAGAAFDGTLLVILDQFEEYFLYHSREAAEGTFADELARCVNRPDLPANFLIAIREDAYAGLGDLFKGLIPNVYGNYLHLEYLDREAARAAIVKPLELYNRQHAGQEPVEIEPHLIEAVLDQVTRGMIQIGEVGSGVGADQRAGTVGEVETPYLQLVMKRLWEDERAAGSHVLRLSTLQSMGGAATIIGTHLDQAMAGLPEREQDVAAAAFRFLVTPSGTKIALSVPDLAQLAEVPGEELGRVVERLSAGDVRILRPVASGDHGGAPPYEIFHDALARPILDWRTRYSRTEEEQRLAARLAEEREEKEQAQRETLAAQEREEKERRRARIFRTLMIFSILLVLVAAAAVAFALLQKADADAQAARAQSSLLANRLTAAATDPTLGPVAALLGGLEAYRLSPTVEARETILGALQENAGLPKIVVGHVRAVTALAYAPTGLLASGSNDASIRLWGRNGQAVGHPLRTGTFADVAGLAFSPDGKLLVAARDDGTLDLWVSTPNGFRLQRHAVPAHSSSGATSVAFSPDGLLLASAGADGKVWLWDRKLDKIGNAPLSFGDPTHSVHSVAFGPSGRTLVAARNDGTVDIWDVSDPATPLHLTYVGDPTGGNTARSVAVSPHNMLAAAIGSNIELWNITDPRHPHASGVLDGATDSVLSVVFADQGRLLVSGGEDDNVEVWDLGRRRVLGPPRTHDDWVEAVAVSPDGMTIASGSDDKLVKLWPLAGSRALATIVEGIPAEIWKVVAAPQHRVITAGGSAGAAVWSVNGSGSAQQAAAALFSIPHPRGDTYDVAVHGDVLAEGEGRTFSLWRLSPRGRPRQLGHAPKPRADQPDDTYALAFRADGNVLATIDGRNDRVVNLWDVSNPAKGIRWLGHTKKAGVAMNDITFVGSAGTVLATADDDGRVRLWNVADPRKPAALGKPLSDVEDNKLFALGVSPNGKLLAAGGASQAVQLWNVANPSKPVRFGAPLFQSDSVQSIAFSPDGRVIASGGRGETSLWDVSSGHSLGELIGRQSTSPNLSAVDTLTFDPADGVLLSGGRGNPVVAWKSILWSNDGKQLHDAGCSLAGRNLRQDEWTMFAQTRLAHSRHRTCNQFPLP
jgi:WD40 repeat protein